MKTLRLLTLLFGVALLPATYFPLAHADEWDKATKITFSEPVEVPGRVLPAGTYTFKLLDSASNRHIVQIFNEDRSALITTIMAIPNERLEPAGKTILTYDSVLATSPWPWRHGSILATPSDRNSCIRRRRPNCFRV